MPTVRASSDCHKAQNILHVRVKEYPTENQDSVWAEIHNALICHPLNIVFFSSTYGQLRQRPPCAAVGAAGQHSTGAGRVARDDTQEPQDALCVCRQNSKNAWLHLSATGSQTTRTAFHFPLTRKRTPQTGILDRGRARHLIKFFHSWRWNLHRPTQTKHIAAMPPSRDNQSTACTRCVKK